MVLQHWLQEAEVPRCALALCVCFHSDVCVHGATIPVAALQITLRRDLSGCYSCDSSSYGPL